MTFGPGTLFSDPDMHDPALYDLGMVRAAGWSRWLTDTCGCQQPFRLVARIIGNGSTQIVLRCASCERLASNPIDQKTLGPRDWEIARANRELLTDPDRPCARCGVWRNGVEWHHWAPRALFDDADQWPGCFLCVKCHKRWHTVMDTPYNQGMED
jgi:hypothetical protein